MIRGQIQVRRLAAVERPLRMINHPTVSITRRTADPLYKTIPIIINNFEALVWPRTMIYWLLKVGLKNIHIVDNGSTYGPLIKFYERLPRGVTLHRLGKNSGELAPWTSGVVDRLRSTCAYYVVTDPDLDLTHVPRDFLTVLARALDRHPRAPKVGLSLEIGDLDASRPLIQEVFRIERPYWTRPVYGDAKLLHAPVDTTLAIYRSASAAGVGPSAADLRAARPYTARHLPWYLTRLDAEARHRYNRAKTGYWGRRIKHLPRAS